MGTLKAGKHGDLAGSMAEAISRAMDDEWQHRKGSPLGAMGKDDREMLFSAIARGVLGYLEAKQNELDTTTNDQHAHHLIFNVIDP